MQEPMPSLLNSRSLQEWMAALDSLMDGDAFIFQLIGLGPPAIPVLAHHLLATRPRTVALPRCRTARALGTLGARQELMAYFRDFHRPEDPAALLAEDAVRSTVAEELAHWKSDDVYQTLLTAAQDRMTGGLIRALSSFRRDENIPVFFAALDDDFCRIEATNALRLVPDPARAYALLYLRGLTGESLSIPSTRYRRRVAVQLLREFGVSPEAWPMLRPFLDDEDTDTVIATAAIGFQIGDPIDRPLLVQRLFTISSHLNCIQEDDILGLLETQQDIARDGTRHLKAEAIARGERPDWMVPRWRIIWHFTDQASTQKDKNDC